ncbi:MAG: HAD family hydrolase [Sphingorhabdus sp.]
MSGRPLLISDCDEVLLHMVVPFQRWLDEAHHIHFDLLNSDWGEALRHKHDGTLVERGMVWDLLNGFFTTEMHRQQPIEGAVASLNRLSEIADVVILTNLMNHHNASRAEQLRAVGIEAPVYTNQGGKGVLLAELLEKYRPSVAVFVDDLDHQHESVAATVPHVWRLHFVGEPVLWPRVKASVHAHQKLTTWREAEKWISEKLLATSHAPIIEKVTS